MYANLLLGLLALCLFWVLVRRICRSATDGGRPAAYLFEAMERQIGSGRRVERARAAMDDLAAEKLRIVCRALEEMRGALPPPLADATLEWEVSDSLLRIRMARPDAEDVTELFVAWRISRMDLDRLANGDARKQEGHFAVRQGMQREEPFADEDALIRHLAAVIAENLASGM